MRHAMPWNVKGVDANARDAAREAAQRAGMTLGEWLNHVISANADDPEPEAAVSDVAARLETITERLETMTRRASDVAIPRASAPKRDDREIIRALDAVARLAEISERRSAEALKAVQEARLDERASLARPSPAPRRPVAEDRRPSPPPYPAEFERTAHPAVHSGADERRLAAIAESVATLSRAIDQIQIGQARPAPPPRAAAPSDPSAIAAAVRAAAASAAHERPRPFDFDLRDTVAAIADRQRALNAEAAPAPARAIAPDGVAALAERLDRMQADLAALRHAGPPPGEDRQRAAYLADLKEISGRIDAINRAPDPALQRDIHQIARKLDQLGANSPAPDVAPSLARLAEEIEGFRRDFLNRGADRSDAALAGLRQDIAGLADAIEGLAPRSAVERLRDDIDALGGKLTDARRQGGGSTALEQLVAQLEEAVRRMTPVDGLSDDVKALARKIDGMGAGGVDGDTLRHLADEAEDIRKAVGRAARQDSVEQLADDVRALAERVEARIDQGRHEPQRLADLIGARIDELAARLDQGPRAEGERPAVSDTRGIEDAMARLVAKLDAAQRRDGAPDALDALEQQIVALAQKIDRRDGADKLGAIERGLSDLFVQLEEMRASAVESAERAARAALAASGGDRGGGVDVDAIRRDMQDLKAQARAAESQTHSTLDAVQKTLETVVSRVAALDEAPRAAPAPAPPAPKPAAAVPAAQMPAPIAPPLDLTAVVAKPAPARAEPAIEPPRPRPAPPAAEDAPVPAVKSAPQARPAGGPVNDLLIEPRSGSPRARPSAAGSAAAPKGDFIAAARRAAQAAAAEAASAPQPSRKDQAASLLGKLTGKGAKAAEPASPRVEPPAPAVVASHVVDPATDEAAPDEVERVKSGIAAKRRTILLGVAAAIILIAAGFATIANFRGIQASAPPASEPARVGTSTSAEPSAPVRSVGVTRIQPGEETPAPTPSAQSETPPPGGRPAPPPQAQLDGPITTGSVAEAVRPAPPPGATISATGWQPVGRDTRPARPGAGAPAQLRAAVERGEAAAQFELATRLLEGRGMPVDAREAARLYRLAADQGLAPAQYRLGSLLEKGTGAPRDVQEARRLYEAAARAGNGKAMHNLAVLFAQGALGERPDYRQASSWFRRAAEHGVADSQYNLAILYARGLGVETNLGESFKWFALAGAGGDADARKKSEEIAARLDAQSLVAARLAVQTFTPRPEPEDAIGVTPPAGGWGDAPTAQRAAPARPPVAAAR